MKGKATFSADEATDIRAILRELRGANCSKPEQKKLRGRLRKEYKFYITDFDSSGKGFSEADFNALLEEDVIWIT